MFANQLTKSFKRMEMGGGRERTVLDVYTAYKITFILWCSRYMLLYGGRIRKGSNLTPSKT